MATKTMNLQELKIIIDKTIENLRSYQKPEEIPVLITTAERSIGVGASSKVVFAGMGFDWEQGQFRIEPEEKLVRLKEKQGKAKPVTTKPPESPQL